MAVATADSMEVTTNRDVTNEQLAAELAVTETPAAEPTPAPAEKPTSTAVREEPPAEAPRPDDDAEPEPDPASDAGKKLAGKKKSMQQRIDELTWQRHQEAAKREELEKQLEALKTPKPETAAPDTDRPRLKQFTEQIGTTYETYEDAVDAHTEALADYKLAARDKASIAARQTHGYQAALHQTRTRGAETHADFDAKIESMVQEGRRFTPFMTDAILTDPDHGHDLAYVLATEPETYHALATAPSLPVASRLLGRILTRFDAAPSGSAPKAAPLSKAKPPIQPLGSSPVAADPDPDEIPFGPNYVKTMNRKFGK